MIDFILSLFRKPKTLHGFNLNRWHYLGFSRINFVGDEETNVPVLGRADAFFFTEKSNTGNRRYVIVPIGSANWNFHKEHHWGVEVLPLWEIGEGHIASNIHTPSDFLQDYLLETEDVVYDYKTKSWHKHGTEAPKYSKKAKSSSTIKKEEDNVVTVDFNKDKDDK